MRLEGQGDLILKLIIGITGLPENLPHRVFRLYWGYMGIMEKKMETTIL